MDKAKMEAIVHWHEPTNVKQLRGFMGLNGYYRKFIQAYATKAQPLTDLLKEDSF